MQKGFKFILFILLFAVMAGCNSPADDTMKHTQAGYGTLKLSMNTENHTPAEVSSKGIATGKFVSYKISVKGIGFDEIEEIIPFQEIYSWEKNIPAVSNVVVLLQPLDASGEPVMGSAVMGGFGNIISDQTVNIKISWERTAMAHILAELLSRIDATFDANDYNVYQAGSLQEDISMKYNNGSLHPLTVKTEQVAAKIIADTAYEILEAVDLYDTVDVEGQVLDADGQPVSGASIFVNEPFAHGVITTDENGIFTVTDLAPGTWNIFVAGDGGSAVLTVNENSTYAPSSLAITKGNNAPYFRYQNYGISTYVENDNKYITFYAEVKDLDGISDISEVAAISLDGTMTYVLADDANGKFDKIAGNGTYELVMENPNPLPLGGYKFQVSDKSGTSTEAAGTSYVSYLTSPVITSIHEGDVISPLSPLQVIWNAVDNAYSYDVYLYKQDSDTPVCSTTNISNDITSCTIPASELDGGSSYILKVYARDSSSIEYTHDISVRTLQFSVFMEGTAGLDLDFGGARLIYYQMENNIMKRDLKTGECISIYDSSDAFSLEDISSDQHELLFIEDGVLYRMRVDGTRIFPLVEGRSVSTAAWSPDGKKIVFRDSNSYYAINADGSNLLSLGSHSAPSYCPEIVYAKDSSKIYCVSGQNAIYEITLDGTTTTSQEIYNNSSYDQICSLQLSPDGTKLALLDQYYDEVHVIDLATGTSSLVYNYSYSLTGALSWTQDGQIIAQQYASGYKSIMLNPDAVNDYTTVHSSRYIDSVGFVPGKVLIFRGKDYSNNYVLAKMNFDGTGYQEIATCDQYSKKILVSQYIW